MKLNKFSSIGASVYLSTFEQQKSFLLQIAKKGASVFTSLHIQEEFSPDYPQRAKQMCRWLAQQGFYVIADVSPRTLSVFGEQDVVMLANSLGVSALRLDYGFNEKQMEQIAAEFPIVVNASTLQQGGLTVSLQQLAVKGLSALHNYYPRPETGLDDDFLYDLNQTLKAQNIPIGAFVPGDQHKRGPIHEGLPTLEKHRSGSPLAAFAELMLCFGVDQVFLGDLSISQQELAWIQSFADTGVLPIPAQMEEPYQGLFDQVFTCRQDSPAGIVRFAESREYACKGKDVLPTCSLPRVTGCITMDNIEYQRYVGEIQLLRKPYPMDHRVNIIGYVPPAWHSLFGCITGGTRFKLVPANQ